MNRQEKEHLIQELRSDFQKSQASFLVGYKGLTVAQVTKLRRQLRDQGGSFKVAKVTLIERVVRDMPEVSGLEPFLKEQIGLVFADKESPAIAKVLQAFAKEHQSLSIVAGAMESKILSAASVEILASLPSREILLAQVLGTMQAPMAGFVCVINALIVRLVIVLKEVEKKKSEA